MRTHVLLFAMCLVSAVLGSTFTMTLQRVYAQSPESLEVPSLVVRELKIVDELGDQRMLLGFEERDGLSKPFFAITRPTGAAEVKIGYDHNGMPCVMLNDNVHSPLTIKQGDRDMRRGFPDERL